MKNIKGILDKHVSPLRADFYELKLHDSANLTLGKYFEILDRDLRLIDKLTQRTGLSIELSDLNVSRFDLIEAIKNYYAELKMRNTDNYDVELKIFDDRVFNTDSNQDIFPTDNYSYQIVNGVEVWGKLTNSIFMKGDWDLLKRGFDNLIENAEKHGFNNSTSIKNRVEIDVMLDYADRTVQIDFSNTGQAVSKGFTLEKFTQKGIKAGENGGDGIGLWFIHEIVKVHGGRLGFTDETGPESIESDLVSTFELTFPIELEIKEDEI